MLAYLMDSVAWSFAFGAAGAFSTAIALNAISRPQRGRFHRRDDS